MLHHLNVVLPSQRMISSADQTDCSTAPQNLAVRRSDFSHTLRQQHKFILLLISGRPLAKRLLSWEQRLLRHCDQYLPCLSGGTVRDIMARIDGLSTLCAMPTTVTAANEESRVFLPSSVFTSKPSLTQPVCLTSMANKMKQRNSHKRSGCCFLRKRSGRGGGRGTRRR